MFNCWVGDMVVIGPFSAVGCRIGDYNGGGDAIGLSDWRRWRWCCCAGWGGRGWERDTVFLFLQKIIFFLFFNIRYFNE